MEMIAGELKNGTRYLKVTSDTGTNYEHRTVNYILDNDCERVEYTYTVGNKIKSDKVGDTYYDWYQLDGAEIRADKTPAIYDRIAGLEEFVIENQYQITLLQLGIDMEV